MSATKKLMAGILAVSVVAGTSACSSESSQEVKCDDWDYDKKTNAYVCDDDDNSSHGFYYYNGGVYSDKSSLRASSKYKSSTKSSKPSISLGKVKVSSSSSSSKSSSFKSSSTKSSGFGGGSRSFGG